MFMSEISLTGKHAYYLKFLGSTLDEENKYRIFNRYIDVYMNAAIIGFLYGEKEEKGNEKQYSNETAKIFADTVQKENSKLTLIYRTIMLLDNKDSLTTEDRVNKAFKDNFNKEDQEKHHKNLELFNSYVRGGITLLYNKFTLNALNYEDYIENINDFVDDYYKEWYSEEYTREIDYEEV